METFKKITFVIVAIAPLAVSACTSLSTSDTVGASDTSGYRTSVPTATDTEQPGVPQAPGNYGSTFVGRPEPGFDPDSIIEAP